MADADRTPWQRSSARHVYVAHVRVRFHELDPLGHVNNAAYLNYLEQAAIDHAAAAGFDMATLRGMGGLFIARRHEIDYLRPALGGDRLRVITWPESLGGARALRRYLIVRLSPDEAKHGSIPDGLQPPDAIHAPAADVVVRARTEWAFVDPESGRPRRIPTAVVAEFVQGKLEQGTACLNW